MAVVHPSAAVDPAAHLDDGVEIGPCCVVEAGAVIGAGTKLMSHVVLRGQVRIGTGNVFHPHCTVGGEPQDFGYRGEPTWVAIGDRNVFREGCTVHRATVKEHGVTAIGSDGYFMCGSHFAHDTRVGDHVTMANNVMLGGHVHVGDCVTLSGGVGAHQFVRIGSHAFIGAMTKLTVDVPPFMLVDGHPAEVICPNAVGLRRRGFTTRELHCLQATHRLLYRQKATAAEAVETLKNTEQWCAPVAELFEFLEARNGGRQGRGREGRRAA